MINTYENIIFSNGVLGRGGRGDAPITTTTTTTTTTSTTTTSTTTTTTTCPPVTISTNGLVLYNRCCSLSGSVWYDVSGNGNHALVSGSALVLSGSLGYSFNGSDNYLTYPANLTATPSSSWTMQWYTTLFNNDINRYDLFCKVDYNNGWDTIYNSVEDWLVFRDQDGADFNKNFNYINGTKVLITMTCDADNNKVGYYIDTTNFGTGSQVSPVNDFNTVNLPLTFGFNSNTDAGYFQGTISDLIIYNRILTSTEVTDNYNTLSSVNTCS